MFAEILAFAALWLAVPAVFYGLIIGLFVIASIGISTTDEYDSGLGFWATVSSLGIIGLVGHHFGVTWSGLVQNWPLTLGAFGAYFVVGIAWSFAKWYFHLSNVRETFQMVKAAFLERHDVSAEKITTALIAPEAPDADAGDFEHRAYEKAKKEFKAEAELIERFAAEVNEKMRSYKPMGSSTAIVADPSKIVQSIKPEAAKHKAAITEWIAFWPVSFTWTMINDPVRKIVNYIFSRIKGTFQKMSDSMFAGV